MPEPDLRPQRSRLIRFAIIAMIPLGRSMLSLSVANGDDPKNSTRRSGA